ncbi:FMN-binding protein [Actinomadura geliboluensis]|uniref:FMN-binding protein n=1 Tax=Actinomadura geliboluensis TaxID=882440 RepID=A0A5S4H7N5_9ACTN|nr:FMN-binding protein [Actinomadura geliboluensis]TMR41019.1 FMN-binding protein [Actinomadura geliboluensis]
MRRATIATGTTLAGVVLLLSLKPHHQAVPVTRPPSPEPPAPGGIAAAAANGTYRGQSVDTEYGPVQVEITMSKGHLTAVRVLRAPSSNGRDREIAAMALPRLTEEALTAGNARIDAVSGATYTSEGYITSLQSALDQAHA